MIERATGLVLRIRPLTETSLIVQWLTPDVGRLSTVAKGARRPKSPFRGKLDLFFLAEFSFRRSRRSDLHALYEVSLQETHAEIRRDLAALEQASYAVRLIEQVTETETPLPEMFRLLLGMLVHFKKNAPTPLTLYAFELKLLRELGLQPGETALSAGTRALVNNLTASDWAEIGLVRASEPQLCELRRFLRGFMVYHLGVGELKVKR
jgi:DNA repair protein RecO (recombination protein O)